MHPTVEREEGRKEGRELRNDDGTTFSDELTPLSIQQRKFRSGIVQKTAKQRNGRDRVGENRAEEGGTALARSVSKGKAFS